MKHFGTIVFGCLTAVAILGVLWLSHGGGSDERHAAVFGLVVAPILYLIFVGPFALLFVLSLIRGMRN